MKKITITLLVISLFVGCKTPKVEKKEIVNNIKSITITEDSSMVNPMYPPSKKCSIVLKSNLTLKNSNCKEIKITKAEFNSVIQDIKYIDLSKLKEIKLTEPLVGSSFKTLTIKTDRKEYSFNDDGKREYPVIIKQLRAKVSKLSKLKLLKDGVENLDKKTKQELTKATDWISSWDTCKGDGAIKTDGTLWQFGKVGGCDFGHIIPIDPETGKSIWKEKCSYYLNPKKMGSGFNGAQIINGGYRVYAIKRDGTLWGWGEELGHNPKKLSSSKNWVDFTVVDAGNGCCAYDIGLQRDGSLWRFPEFMKPLRLKRVGKSYWSKIIIECCTIYGEQKDGTIWMKDGTVPFERYSKRKCGVVNKELCMNIKAKLEEMPKNSILNYSNPHQRVKVRKKAGTLWNHLKCEY